MYSYRITEIGLNDGTRLKTGNLVVIVGPNNAGKSRALRDIVNICAPQQNVNSRPLVVLDADWSLPTTLQDLNDRNKVFIRDEPNGERILRTLDPNLLGERNFSVTGWNDENFKTVLGTRNHFAAIFGAQFIAHLSTQSRLQLVQQTQSPQFRLHRVNVLHNLYWKGRDAEQKIRAAIKAQFDVDIALDFSTLSQMLFRVSRNMQNIPADPREAAELLEKYERLDDQGDGLRSFSGIMAAVVSADRDVFLIDEPEAFLHPPQAYRIGEMLAESASENTQIFVATHSSDVLQGMLAKATTATILRIDRVADINRFKILDQSELQNIIKDPLLQSARVLDGIYYPTALVVEADSDARFYHAALRKVSSKLDVHTVNAQNKQTVARVRAMYKKLGIRSVGLVDFDVLNDKQEFAQHLTEIGLEPDKLEEVREARERIAAFVQKLPARDRMSDAITRLRQLLQELDREIASSSSSDDGNEGAAETALQKVARAYGAILERAKPWNAFKERGRDALDDASRAHFDQIASICRDAGLIINKYGELESMLVDLGIEYTTDKRAWIQRALVLLPNLQVDESRNLWRLMNEVRVALAGTS